MKIELLNPSAMMPGYLHSTTARDGKGRTTEWEAVVKSYKSATEFDREFLKNNYSNVQAGDVIEYGLNEKRSNKYTDRYRTYAVVEAVVRFSNRWATTDADAKELTFLLLVCYETCAKAVKSDVETRNEAVDLFLSEGISAADAESLEEKALAEAFKLIREQRAVKRAS